MNRMLLGLLLVNVLVAPRLMGQSEAEHQKQRIRFTQARVLAARMVEAIAVNELDFAHLPDQAQRDRVAQFYDQYRGRLARDIRSSKHLWQSANANGACGQTSHQARAVIYLSYAQCPLSTYTPMEAAKLLVGESAHHFPQTFEGHQLVVGDEFADWVKRAVFQAYVARLAASGTATPTDGDTEREAPLLTGLYESDAYPGVLVIRKDGTIYLGSDKNAYGDVETVYNFRTIPGNPNGALQKLVPHRYQQSGEPSYEEQRLYRDPATASYFTYAGMGFTGTMNYHIGGNFFYRGPYQCEVGIFVRVKPLFEGKFVNLTIRRPQRLIPHDCRHQGVIEEHIGFRLVGQLQGF